MGTKKFYKYLIGARCARFRVLIPACAGMTIFVNKNCKKYFDKLLFIAVFLSHISCLVSQKKKNPPGGGFFECVTLFHAGGNHVAVHTDLVPADIATDFRTHAVHEFLDSRLFCGINLGI